MQRLQLLHWLLPLRRLRLLLLGQTMCWCGPNNACCFQEWEYFSADLLHFTNPPVWKFAQHCWSICPMHRASASCVVSALLHSTKALLHSTNLDSTVYCRCTFGIQRFTPPGVTTVRSQTIFMMST
jgi:hypothetical protein